MPWLKLLHVATIICWCGLLLYLPAVIAQAGGRVATVGATGQDDAGFERAMSHRLFTLVATPAALLAIASGTVIILVEQPIGLWLILKLTAVTAMVACHALLGVLIFGLEQRPARRVGPYCAALAITSFALILCVAWLVLRKAP